MQKIIKGDDVIVIAGRDKGKRGTVLDRVSDTHLLIEGVNSVKKHQRGNPMQGQPGGITDKTMPIDQSNVMVFNPGTSKGDRIGIKTLEDGKKARYFKSNGELVKG